MNMIILENGPYQTIRRHRISEEIGSTCTIGKAVASMASANCRLTHLSLVQMYCKTEKDLMERMAIRQYLPIMILGRSDSIY